MALLGKAATLPPSRPSVVFGSGISIFLPRYGFQGFWSQAALARAETFGPRIRVRQWMPSRPVQP